VVVITNWIIHSRGLHFQALKFGGDYRLDYIHPKELHFEILKFGGDYNYGIHSKTLKVLGDYKMEMHEIHSNVW
jgi:hypothetical protein